MLAIAVSNGNGRSSLAALPRGYQRALTSISFGLVRFNGGT